MPLQNNAFRQFRHEKKPCKTTPTALQYIQQQCLDPNLIHENQKVMDNYKIALDDSAYAIDNVARYGTLAPIPFSPNGARSQGGFDVSDCRQNHQGDSG